MPHEVGVLSTCCLFSFQVAALWLLIGRHGLLGDICVPLRPQDCAGSLAAQGHASSGWYIGVSSVGASGLSSKVLDLSCFSQSSWRGEARWAPAHDGHTCRCVSQAPSQRLSPLASHRDVRLGLHRAVWRPHGPPGQARVLCLLAEHRAALIQILTAIVMVGWIMSIFWGMDMVILASE